jgi:outer membrane lipoprotein-sorting protein
VIKDGQQVSLSDTENEIYDPSTNTVTVSPLPPAIHQREVSRGVDLADELKRMIDSDQATATPTTYNGIPAYGLTLNPSGDNC